MSRGKRAQPGGAHGSAQPSRRQHSVARLDRGKANLADAGLACEAKDAACLVVGAALRGGSAASNACQACLARLCDAHAVLVELASLETMVSPCRTGWASSTAQHAHHAGAVRCAAAACAALRCGQRTIYPKSLKMKVRFGSKPRGGASAQPAGARIAHARARTTCDDVLCVLTRQAARLLNGERLGPSVRCSTGYRRRACRAFHRNCSSSVSWITRGTCEQRPENESRQLRLRRACLEGVLQPLCEVEGDEVPQVQRLGGRALRAASARCAKEHRADQRNTHPPRVEIETARVLLVRVQQQCQVPARAGREATTFRLGHR